ncbi:MAG TPA: metal-dependent hydrolase [Noviherbaspirillum sp.]|nr:metal-dependent hydrolase [Noviherbaspirillum sp.]
MTPPQSTTPDHIVIEPRRPRFDFSDTPRHWLRDPYTSQFMNALSVFIPFSERTVIEILRKYRDRVSDPKLRAEIEALIRQEGSHALLHRQTNQVLARCGYRAVPAFERLQKAFFQQVRRCAPETFEITIPAAFEHFTAAIAKDFLRERDFWAGGKSNGALEFATWHALEEVEHQAVCLDFYLALRPTPWVLTLSLLLLWMPATVVSIYGVQLYLLHKDRLLYRPRNWWPYLRFVGRTLPMLLDSAWKYLKTDYRTWGADDEDLYKRQKQNLPRV